jgi:hypothetical protein
LAAHVGTRQLRRARLPPVREDVDDAAVASSASSASFIRGSQRRSRLGTSGAVGSGVELTERSVHTYVLPNGKVFAGDGGINLPVRSMNMSARHSCGILELGILTRRLNRGSPTVQKLTCFCSGHAFLPDGRLLVAGGHITDSNGLNQACVYNYQSNAWTALPLMNQGRWYPSATTLADGRILVLSGSFIKDGMTMVKRSTTNLEWPAVGTGRAFCWSSAIPGHARRGQTGRSSCPERMRKRTCSMPVKRGPGRHYPHPGDTTERSARVRALGDVRRPESNLQRWRQQRTY